MVLTKEQKHEIFKKFGGSEKNSGSTESQIALFTARIAHLTGHLQKNKKDFGTQRSLLNMVGQRRAALNYLKSRNLERYRSLIKELEIRK